MNKNLNQPIDILEVMQRITIEVIGKFAFEYEFGCLDSVEVPRFVNNYKFIMTFVTSAYRNMFPWIGYLPTEQNRQFHDAVKEFDEFVFNIIKTRKNEIRDKKVSDNGRDGLLTSIIKFSEQEGIHMDDKTLRDQIVAFFVAGHDTTSMALSTSLYYLARYPEMQEKARDEAISILGNEPVIPTSNQLKEMKYITAIIKETLRMYPPASINAPRKLQKPMKMGPHLIPKNVLCSVNTWQVHYNPNYWENPKQYNPERFLKGEKRHPFAWIPFSYGPRNCVGRSFSLMEQKVILSMILLKYNIALPKNSINKDKLVLKPLFLLRPLDLKLLFSERIKPY